MGSFQSVYAYWWLKTIKGILFLLFGIVALIYSPGSLQGLVFFLGLIASVTGVSVFTGAILSKDSKGWGWFLAEGITDVLLGIILLANPQSIEFLIPFLFGFWGIFLGIFLLGLSITLKCEPIPGWWIVLLFGIIFIASGCFVIIYPVIGTLSIVMVISMQMIIFGIIAIIHSLHLKNMQNEKIF